MTTPNNARLQSEIDSRCPCFAMPASECNCESVDPFKTKKSKTKTYTVQIEASITVSTFIEVTATTEDEALEKAEDQFRDYAGIAFRACDGNDDVARELHFSSTFDVGDVETEVIEYEIAQ